MKKSVSFFLAMVLTLGLSFPAAGVTVPADPLDYIDFQFAPEKREYAAGEKICINWKLSVTAFAEFEDADLSMSYSSSDTYLTAGEVYEHYDRLDYGDARTSSFSLFEDESVVERSERLGPLLRRIVQFFVHLFSLFSPALRRMDYQNSLLKEDLCTGVQTAFSPRRCVSVGVCRVLYDGREITCRFTLSYGRLRTIPVLSAEETGRAVGRYSISAAVTPDDTGVSGLLFGASFAGGAASGGLFFLDAVNGRIGLAALKNGETTILAVKNAALTPGQVRSVSLHIADGRLTAYLNETETENWPVFDLFVPFGDGSVGVCGNATKPVIGDAEERFSGETYTNPLYEDSADPYVLYDDGVYYMYATNCPTGYCASRSTDLVHWEPIGQVAHKDDIYGDESFWAPEVYQYRGRYYLFYTTDMHLAVAVADSPEGPFVKTSDSPLFEQRAIDGNVFFDDEGKAYLYVVHYDQFGGQLWGYELAEDLTSVKQETGVLLAKAEGWEDRTIEGPYMIKHDGVYYLTYSGSQFESVNYAVGYLTSDRPLGKFTRYAYNPILQSTSDIHGPGHHSFAYSPDGSELFIVYHCHYSLTQPMPRKLCIDRVKFVPTGNGPDRMVVLGPTATPQPLPSGS